MRDNTASIICPVALCGWEGHPNHFWEHVKAYETKYEGKVLWEGSLLWKSHDRFASYYFKQLWESNLPDEVKWHKIAFAYVKQQRDLVKKHKKSTKVAPNGQNIEVKNGKYIVDGEKMSMQNIDTDMDMVTCVRR